MSLTLHVSGPGVAPVDIPYDEVMTYPTEEIAENQYRARRVFIVPWSKRWTFCAGMFGWPTLERTTKDFQDKNASHGVDKSWGIRRVIPKGYAALDLDPTGKIFLYAAEIDEMRGEGRILSYDSQGIAVYKEARISIGFKTLSYKVDAYLKIFVLNDDGTFKINENGFKVTNTIVSPNPELVDESDLTRYVTIFRGSNVSYTILPFGGLRWVQSGKEVRVNNSVGFTVPNQELVIVWHQVPTLPEALKFFMGTVNAYYMFTTSQDEFRPSSLLLTSCETIPYRWFFNQRVFDIVYRFRVFDAPFRNSKGPSLKDAKGGDLILDVDDRGHNYFPHYRTDNDFIDYQEVTNDGVYAPIADNLLTVGKLGVVNPQSGWTPYLRANHGALFFPSAPPPTPE